MVSGNGYWPAPTIPARGGARNSYDPAEVARFLQRYGVEWTPLSENAAIRRDVLERPPGQRRGRRQ